MDGGMPHCTGMKTKQLAGTICAPNDRECMEKACRTKCCEDDDCTFYQFEMEEGMGGDAKNVVCQLGEKHQLTDKNCEKPFFGELCVARLPEWPQHGEPHTKCVSGYSIG